MIVVHAELLVFFFADPAPTEIYTLSLHDALPIYFDFAHGKLLQSRFERDSRCDLTAVAAAKTTGVRDRKSTRLNSSHVAISYAVFCLKKKKKTITLSYA